MTWEWGCNECGSKFQTAVITTVPRCPQCRTSDVSRLVSVSDEGIGYEFLDLNCKDNTYPSKKRLRLHVQSGVRKGSDGRLVNKRRVIDKTTKPYQYEEFITDLETGEITRMCKEPLSVHRSRGSAKHKEKRGV